jgi:homoserine dehydrogenase
VGGGIPIIKVIREGLVANRFNLIYGILNGTCNYILTRMERESLTFDKTLNAARELGYVEADESLDLEGWDTAHKAVILAYLAHGKWVNLKDVPIEGIGNITLEDIQWADELGFKIKLLGIISQNNKGKSIFVRVHPTLIRKDKIMANVDGVYNAVSVSGDIVGSGIHIGRGAGQDATASAVIGDVADGVSALLGTPPPVVLEDDAELYASLGSDIELSSLEDVTGQYYLRLSVTDKPGVLAEISTVMADHDVSIASMIQPQESSNQQATLILTTHQSNEKRMQDTIRDLKKLKNVHRSPFLLRIVNFD